MTVTATQLRKDIYRILDQVLETGTPVEIERKGPRLKIVLDEPRSGTKLENLDIAQAGIATSDPLGGASHPVPSPSRFRERGSEGGPRG